MKKFLSLLFCIVTTQAAFSQSWEDPYLAKVKNLPDSELLRIADTEDKNILLPAVIQWHINNFPMTQNVSLDSMLTFARMGIPTAMYQAAVMLKTCKKCADEKASLAWYIEAANSEHPPAAEYVARAYDLGKELPKNKSKSLEYYLIAANGGLSSSIIHIVTDLCTNGDAFKNRKKVSMWVDRLNVGLPKDKRYEPEDFECKSNEK